MSRAGLSSFCAATASRQHDSETRSHASDHPHTRDEQCHPLRTDRRHAPQHARELERRVARRAQAEPQTIEDACSYAWLQLLTHPSVDLDEPSDARSAG